MSFKNSKLTIVLLLFIALKGFSQNNYDLIPYPQKLTVLKGNFEFASNNEILILGEKKLGKEVIYLRSVLANYKIKPATQSATSRILLRLSTDVTGEESYKLQVRPGVIAITAATNSGIFYGIQTLNQLMALNNVGAHQKQIPALHISDQPAYSWRGSMLDVSRHFFNMDYLKRHIDRLAFYKINKFHFHLTDDQGWRIEIKKYPALTEKGAYRTFNNQDSVCMELAKENPDFEIDPRFIKIKDGKETYGGYYTQQELKELVTYAAERHIEIIPEIDMPGHMMAAISVFPELVDGKMGWGELSSTPLCPCKEEVYTFVENVLNEVISIFPSKYIHIGADEVDKTSWEKSELCKAMMKREGMKDIHELQSYFVHRVQKMVESKGKKAIAWDDALEGKINSDITVMYWRGWVAGAPLKAVQNNHPVIMSPTNPLYFDFFPDKSSLRNVYNMKVVYDDIPADKVHLIKGAQANLWAEKIPSENRADFLLFPRLTALSERLWTNKGTFENYSNRLLAHYPVMDKMKIAYRLPDLCGFALESVFVKDAVLKVENPLKDKTIHYTKDGSTPTTKSPVLTGNSLAINQPTSLKFALFSSGGAQSKGDIYTVNYKPSTFATAIKSPEKLESGLSCDFYNQPIDKVAKIAGKPDQQFLVNNINVPKEAKAPQFGLKYNGFIEVPETGIYTFNLTCDDAGMLYIADRLVIDNEGPHSPIEKSGQVALKKGLHPFRLDFVEGGGGYTLLLQYTMDGCNAKDIPNNWFYRQISK